jgi:hypothetical protein
MRVLSLLTPDEARGLGGLPGDAIIGGFTPDPLGGEVFQANPGFIRLLHEVVRVAGPADAALCEAAAGQGEGWVYVIDLRTPNGPQGEVPPEDIIGGFAVNSGCIVPESYRPNDAYRGFTRHGVARLPESLRRALLARLGNGHAR